MYVIHVRMLHVSCCITLLCLKTMVSKTDLQDANIYAKTADLQDAKIYAKTADPQDANQYAKQLVPKTPISMQRRLALQYSIGIWCQVIELTLLHSILIFRPNHRVVTQNSVLLLHIPSL